MLVRNNLKEIREFEETINSSNNILIIPHYNPDGDAIGSALAMYLTLKKIDKKANIISPTQYPNFLKWMPGNPIIEILEKKTEVDENYLEEYDCIICVDFNSTGRCGKLEIALEHSKAKKILIDHHPNPTDFADISFSNVASSSTCELLYDIINTSFLGQYIDKDIATCIYTGIITDTGCFNYNSSNPNTFKVVSKLLEFGIEKNIIYNNVFNNFSINRMKFMGFVMQNRMQVFPEIKTAYIYITAKDRRTFREQFGDTENFVNIPMSIKGIIFTAIFIERDNFIKISFRSKGSFDVNKLTVKHFNGGGHVNASSGESFSTLRETTDKFERILMEEYAETLKNYNY